MVDATQIYEWAQELGVEKRDGLEGMERFGIPEEAVAEFAQMDALDSVNASLADMPEEADPRVVVLSMLAMHTRVYLEMGIWLVKSGRV